MTTSRTIEYLTGFLMGAFLGLGLDSCFYVYNLLCAWRGCAQIQLTCWFMFPLPLLMGIFMSKAIADLHLDDY